MLSAKWDRMRRVALHRMQWIICCTALNRRPVPRLPCGLRQRTRSTSKPSPAPRNSPVLDDPSLLVHDTPTLPLLMR